MSITADECATLDQKRARHAWQKIQSLLEKHADNRTTKLQDNYAREAKKLPARILAAGLGQALAFLHAKAPKPTHEGTKQLLEDLTEWVLHERLQSAQRKAGMFTPHNPTCLLQSIFQGGTDFLRWTTDETLAYLVWLNRFAEGAGLPKKEVDE